MQTVSAIRLKSTPKQAREKDPPPLVGLLNLPPRPRPPGAIFASCCQVVVVGQERPVARLYKVWGAIQNGQGSLVLRCTGILCRIAKSVRTNKAQIHPSTLRRKKHTTENQAHTRPSSLRWQPKTRPATLIPFQPQPRISHMTTTNDLFQSRFTLPLFFSPHEYENEPLHIHSGFFPTEK
jgi:hypothetical protein